MRLKKRSGKASEEINVTHNADDIENIDMTEGEEHTEKIPVQAVQSELEAEGVEVLETKDGWQVNLKKDGWNHTLEDALYFRELFEKEGI